MSTDEYTPFTPDSDSESQSDFSLTLLVSKLYCLSWIRLHLPMNWATFEVYLVCIGPSAMLADEYTPFTLNSDSESRSDFTFRSIRLSYQFC